MEYFKPATAGRYPAVLLLHGADGLKTKGPTLRWLARDLAQHSYVVLLVHYFDRTGVARTAPSEITPADRLAWLDTVRVALGHAARLPQVDGKRIGLVGFSLGAYLAVAAAAEEGSSIAAVVELFGGLPRDLRRNLKSMPPVQIIHGDEDQVVPLAEADKLRDFLEDQKTTLEVHIYCGIGHVFAEPDGKFQMMAALDAKARATRFLDKYLRTEAKAKPSKWVSPIDKPAAWQESAGEASGLLPRSEVSRDAQRSAE